MVGPAVDTRVEEGAVHDQLSPPAEQVEQAAGSVRPVEYVVLVDRSPRHTPALCRQGVAGPRQFLFLDQHLVAGGLPLGCRHDVGHLHGYSFESFNKLVEYLSSANHSERL